MLDYFYHVAFDAQAETRLLLFGDGNAYVRFAIALIGFISAVIVGGLWILFVLGEVLVPH